jgi:hypothetical protein
MALYVHKHLKLVAISKVPYGLLQVRRNFGMIGQTRIAVNHVECLYSVDKLLYDSLTHHGD